ncbi:MAG: DUF6220 domain-containing protein [Dehalococcoidia bacterium]
MTSLTGIDRDHTAAIDATLDPARHEPAAGGNRSTVMPGRRAHFAYQVLAWVLAGCVTVQVFFAGMAIFVNPERWSWHTSFVHAFELLPMIMLVLAFVGRLPARIRWLTAAMWVLIMLQYPLVAMRPGWGAALHPVNGLAIFWLSITLAQLAGHAGRGSALARFRRSR